MDKLSKLAKAFSDALERLREVLAEPKTDITRDSAIKRFEFTFDLCWKSLKAFLEERKGVVCRSPKDCFRAAYQSGVIDYDEFWINLVDERNETAHTYNEDLAEKIYKNLPEALKYFETLLAKIQS